ncbi:MAG TPA: sugar phosphate isomerase/epimerase [Dongiaceae bacterium]|nr:sugar phosphate isomerase/epimerase [Dongiaceae bacterium]
MTKLSMNRRTFVQTSVAAGVLASLPTRGFAAMHQIQKVGVQLYTVRDDMKKDFAGTVAKVAAIGYKEVEFAGYFDHKPAEVRAMLDKDGLTAPSCHVSYDVVENHWPETLDAAHTVGHSFIVCPWVEEKLRKAPDGWKQVAAAFNKAGEASKKAGIQFAYHNHTFEFVPDPNLGGKLPYDFLLANCDPQLVKMEMDLCWISVTGQDPVAYFGKYPGRFPLVHVKDVKEIPKVAPEKSNEFLNTSFEKSVMTSAGSGVIDWKRIFAHADEAGIQHFFVEHDAPIDSFASITESYKYLAALRF